jgi:hypothetical protein
VSSEPALAKCVVAAELGPLPADLVARVDRSIDRVTEA